MCLMKKKPLNRRQLWRIQKIQDAYTKNAEEKNAAMDINIIATPGEELKGLVISNFGQRLDIEALDDDNQGKIFRCFQRSNIGPLVAGDYVIWQEGDPDGVVIATLPRENFLERPTGMGELKPVAANIDQLFIVIACTPEPFGNLIDRYLVAAEHYQIQPIVLLNKNDLITDEKRAAFDNLLEIYRSIDYPVIKVSAKTEENISELKAMLANKTSVFVGQSGVGKSALVNTLLPEADTLEGSLSDARDKGRHTTTAARLYHFEEGGDLIDSPGIREFDLEHLDQETLLEGFIEFKPFLDQCRFRNCRHDQEPGCALKQALKDNLIQTERMESYRQISRTLKEK